jgi:hypothetical protein
MTTLSEALSDWADIDVAAHSLACCLGIFPFGAIDPFPKWVYWTSNPLGDALVRTLDEYVVLGVLEKRDEPDLQYRWCGTYRKSCGLE